MSGGGEDVVGVPVEVLAGAVVAHGRPRIGVTGGDLHVGTRPQPADADLALSATDAHLDFFGL